MNPWLQDANRDGKTLKERTLKWFQVINYLDGFISAKTPSGSGHLNILAPIQTNLSFMKQDWLQNISQSLAAKKCFRKTHTETLPQLRSRWLIVTVMSMFLSLSLSP